MKKLITILFYLSLFSFAHAENKIAYLDMALIMNKSDAGTSINKQIKTLEKKLSDEINKKEDAFKKEKQSLLAQKNILEKTQFEKKILEFNAKLNDHQKKKNKEINDLGKKRLEASQKFLNEVTKILAEYSAKNSLSMVIQKKNIVIGKKEFEITEDILKAVNQKVKKIKIN